VFDFLNGQFGASHYTMVDCQVLKGSLFSGYFYTGYSFVTYCIGVHMLRM